MNDGRAQSVHRDVPFARVDGKELLLDLHMPQGTPDGLIIWVHGGAWREGTRDWVDIAGMVGRGWAIASVDYRLSTEARFPAQIHDIKAAVRFLRAHADVYGFPSSRFIIAGSSAGGHLAALVGVTNGHAELEGTVGEYTDQSSDVQAIIDQFGASDFTTILDQSTPFGLKMRAPALELLLGALPETVPDLARLASPVEHVDQFDPPLLLWHGDEDPQMPLEQSYELRRAYEKVGATVSFRIMHGSAHGGPAFSDEAAIALIDRFLRENLPEAGAPDS
jgi:acetyl esterase/lipase